MTQDEPIKAFPAFAESDEALRQRRAAELRAMLQEAGPLSPEQKQAVVGVCFLDFPAVMRAHRGWKAHNTMESLVASLRLFRASTADLITLLDHFHTASEAPEYWYRVNAARADALETSILKEVVCLSELAHSVQDHCRRVQKVWSCPDFAKHLSAFGDDGQHDFILQLRNAIHHVRMFEPGWELRWSEANERSSHYQFAKAELLEGLDDWGKGERYLQASPENIDVRDLVTEYSARHAKFYEAYLADCNAFTPEPVIECRDIIRTQQLGNLRASWRMLLDILIQRKIDPMAYLDRYLDSAQLAKAAKLPPKSAELIDFVIATIDTEGACDEATRKLAYRLFGVHEK